MRYTRAVMRDGRILDPKVAEAVKITIGMVLGGGYSKSQHKLSLDLRKFILERDGGRCRICGADASQIDHINEDMELIARDINDPENLQAICDECHRKKTLSTFRPAGLEEQAKGREFWERIEAPTPTRICDDEQNWRTIWQKLASERAAAVKAM